MNRTQPLSCLFPRSYILMPLVLVLALAGCQPGGQGGEGAAAKGAGGGMPGADQPPEVTVMVVQQQPVTQTSELAGRLQAMQQSEVRPQTSGIVKRKLFEDGSFVRAGQALFEIDTSSQQQSVASAQAAVRRQQASINAINVRAKRYRALLAENAVSKQEYDDVMAQLALAQADLAASQATLSNARISQGYGLVRAPISGQTGISQVTVGALATASQTTPMVTIQQLDPLYVNISQSSTELLKMRQQMLKSGNGRGNSLLYLTLEDGSDYPHPARLQFSSATVDPATGSVTLRASVPNPQGLLLPGMYVRAKVAQGTLPNAMLVPQQALGRLPTGGAMVLVVTPAGTVTTRPVETAGTLGNQWIITSGLQSGERIVVEGSQRLRMRPGMPDPKVNAKLAGPELTAIQPTVDPLTGSPVAPIAPDAGSAGNQPVTSAAQGAAAFGPAVPSSPASTLPASQSSSQQSGPQAGNAASTTAQRS